MCRFLVYKGQPDILLSDLISEPTHSILTQSFDCRLRPQLHRRPHNADGFGLGYYPDPVLSREPIIYTSPTPAWNCVNLTRMANKTASNLVFVHLRATISGSISQQNCHPFQYGRLMFMHNGSIGGWSLIRRQISESVADQWFSCVIGNTDSEWCFALFLDSMDKLGLPHDDERQNKLNFAVTDGHTVICTRYCNSKREEPTSLFFTSGTEWSRAKPETPKGGAENETKGEFRMHRGDKSSPRILIASEPLTFYRDNWTTVPANSVLTVLPNQSILLHPIVDEVYQFNPGVIRPKHSIASDEDDILLASRNRTGSLASSTAFSSELASLFASDSSFMTDESSAPSVSEYCV